MAQAEQVSKGSGGQANSQASPPSSVLAPGNTHCSEVPPGEAPLILHRDFPSEGTESRQRFPSLQLARLTWWTRNRPRPELEKEAHGDTPGTSEMEMPPDVHPAGRGGTQNPSQGPEQHGGRLRVCWVLSQRSDGDRSSVTGALRHHTLSFLPSHMAIKQREE